MKKYICIIALSGFMLNASAALAQLPSNPWAPNPNDGYFGDNVANTDVTQAPIYDNTANGGEILPVDPWARARDRSGIKTWRGSGQHGKLNYIGEATTYTDAKGQEMIAPEVNRHNMLVMTEHLRNMGYKIPKSYDQKIKDMPQAYGKLLRENYENVFSAEDPFGKSFARILTDVEDGTGLDFENILFNTMDILGTD